MHRPENPLNKGQAGARCHDFTMLPLSYSGSSLDNSVVRWCCISDTELRKCEEWALSIKSDPLVCVQATSMTKCIEMIKVGDSLWSGYVVRPYRVCMSLYEWNKRKTSLDTRGTGGNEEEFMQGSFQPGSSTATGYRFSVPLGL